MQHFPGCAQGHTALAGLAGAGAGIPVQLEIRQNLQQNEQQYGQSEGERRRRMRRRRKVRAAWPSFPCAWKRLYKGSVLFL